MGGSIYGYFSKQRYTNATSCDYPWQILLPCVVLWGVLFLAMVAWVYLDMRVQRISDPKEEKANGSVQ